MQLSVNIKGVEVSTSALYGVLKYVKQIHNPTIFCLEGYPKLFRTYYPKYKSNRSKEEATISVPIYEIVAVCIKYAQAHNIDCTFVFAPNQEADQVIASLCKALNNPKLQLFGPQPLESDFYWKRYSKLSVDKFIMPKADNILIKSTDSDMYQLMSTNIRVAKDLSDNVGVTETPKAVHHLPPQTIPVYKAFMGDISDTVPNLVKGFSTDRFFQILSDVIEDSHDLDDFITKTQNSLKYLGAEDLQAFITKYNLLKQLKVNRNITTLDFYSMPWKLTVPTTMDVDAIVSKYRINI